ncbi:rpoE leader peptide RseD [Enterobacter roggenkampii]|nr:MULTISPECIES: rpoE leader peptide RseD [Enterobacter]MCB5948609.1 rpoE leader peptide RseD [Enterobacter sp. TCD1-1]MCC3238545.1 rpoE leader peptide RseD [Enterobacter cloacae complex sp. 2021EL-01169]MCB7499259.1 rpoE leader peptide RseD [Enterobacter roggenkampii]MCB7502183.1 rpoE leader peptide RseD [Enterobacter roggenkampii]MCE5967272.1 rpoE leader peptide RseD [Enterobacter roggenkampii]
MKIRHSNSVLAQSAVFLEWRFDNAWNLGLGRHYLG